MPPSLPLKTGPPVRESLLSDGNDGDYDPLADDIGYDGNDSDYQVNGDLDWAAKRKKTSTKKGKRKGRPCHKSRPKYVSKCGEQKKPATKKHKSTAEVTPNVR